MIEGDLDIYWENNPAPAATRKYRVSFLRYTPGFEHGAVPRRLFVGEEVLFDCLVALQDPRMDVERRQGRAREWMLELHSKRSLPLRIMMLTELQAAEFSRAATAC